MPESCFPPGEASENGNLKEKRQQTAKDEVAALFCPFVPEDSSAEESGVQSQAAWTLVPCIYKPKAQGNGVL